MYFPDIFIQTMADGKAAIEGPKDPCRMVYAIFFWLGIGTLLPWNMFITVCIIHICTVHGTVLLDR